MLPQLATTHETKIIPFGIKQPILKHIELIKSGILAGTILTPAGNRYDAISAYNYTNCIRWVTKYEEETGTVYLEDINLDWAQDFTIFLMDNDLSKNTIASILKRVKAVLKRLCAQGLTTFDGSGIKATGEDVTAIFNDTAELEYLINLDLTDRPGLSKIRDLYYLHSYLGLRFRDFKAILQNPKDYLRKVGHHTFFEIKTNKTGATVAIPIGTKAAEILDKNDFDFGASFSHRHYNDYLKEMGQAAGWDDTIIFSRTNGGQRQDVKKLKWELVASHTARRNFATNAYLAGVDIYSIMQITGHTTEASFKKYIRCSSMASAIKIADHSFFN